MVGNAGQNGPSTWTIILPGLASALFAPGTEGLLVMVLWTLIGVGIYRRRKASTPS